MLLEFEKPIALLEDKLILLKKEAIEGKQRPSLTNAIEKLEKEVKSLQKEVFSSLTPWQRVQLSRHPNRPYTLDYINRISEDFMEFHGDRNAGDDNAIVGGFGRILINTASQPSVTGATLIKGDTWLLNTDMYMTIQYNGNATQYWFEQIAP